jgi:hypothetical protein
MIEMPLDELPPKLQAAILKLRSGPQERTACPMKTFALIFQRKFNSFNYKS